MARHAHASAVEVTVSVADPRRLVATVTDNGVGVEPGQARSGLLNLRQRAEQYGGTFTLASVENGGAALGWSVPL